MVDRFQEARQLLEALAQLHVLRLVPQAPDPGELAVADQLVTCNTNEWAVVRDCVIRSSERDKKFFVLYIEVLRIFPLIAEKKYLYRAKSEPLFHRISHLVKVNFIVADVKIREINISPF